MTSENYLGINLSPAHLQPIAQDLLSGFYCREGETPEMAFARAAVAFSDDLVHAQDIYDDVAKGWAMFSSPILSNAPLPGEKPKAMPISCFLGYVPDTREGLVDHQVELAWLSMMGGGFGGHWSDIRAAGDKSVGPIPHIAITDRSVEGFRQGKTRKGSYAAYLSVDHPDIVEFVGMRKPTGGDVNRKCFNIHHAVNITDDFMAAVLAGSQWELRCPHSKRVVETVDARGLWELILETRFKTGEPYLNFIDTANRALPDYQKAKGLKIHGSNLCNEIHLATSPERTAVCCLSSVNLEYWDAWKQDHNFIGRWIRFLDNVLEFFIQNADVNTLHRAIDSAQWERSVGLGAMGFHYLLQQKGIPWESAQAVGLNKRIFRYIQDMAREESETLAHERGPCPDAGPRMIRNSHLLAIAPNANSGLICGTSPSIEPVKANAFVKGTRAGKHLIKNPYLDEIIKEYCKDAMMPRSWYDDVWQSIVLNGGSVQHLEWMDPWDKDVFKTAVEIDPRWQVQHVCDRQEFICQGQSANLYFPSGTDRALLNEAHLKAWKGGAKGLYYLKTEAGVTGDKVSHKVERVALKDYDQQEECLACQG